MTVADFLDEPLSFTAKATGYHPVSPDSPQYSMEGGNVGAEEWHGEKLQQEPLFTLDAYRRGEVPYVSVAMDNTTNNPFPYGSMLESPDMPGVKFRVMDTGSAFRGRGLGRVDIARDTAAGANSEENNRPLRFVQSTDQGEQIRGAIGRIPQRQLLAGKPTAASLQDFLDSPDDSPSNVLDEDTTKLAVAHGLTHGGAGVAAGWGLAALGDVSGFNEVVSAATGPAAPLTFGGLNMLEFLGGALLGERGIDTAEKALAKYVPAIENMRTAARDHPVANQVAATIPMLPFAWKSAKGYYDIAKAAESVPEAAKIITARVGGGAAAGTGLEAIRPHLEAAFNNIGLKLGFTPEEIQQPNTRSFIENAAIGAALNGMFGMRALRDTSIKPILERGGEQSAKESNQAAGALSAEQRKSAEREAESQAKKRDSRKTSAQREAEAISELRQSASGVTAATVVPDVPTPEKAPKVGVFGAGKRLVKDTFQRWLGNWDQARQNALGRSGFVGARLLKLVPDAGRRVAIYNWAAAGGDEALLQEWIDAAPKDVKQGYQDALTLSEHEKSVGAAARDSFDEWFQRARDLGMLEKATPDYLKRIVIKRPEIAEEMMHDSMGRGSRLSTSFPEARRRFYQQMVDAENEGVRYDKDIAKSVYAYARSFSDAAVNRAALKQLFDLETENGRPMFVVQGQGHRVNPGEENQALMVTPYGVRRISGQAAEAARLKKLHPNWSDEHANGVAKQRILGEYVQMPEARELRGWQWVDTAEDGTQTLVQGDVLVHKSVADLVRNKFAPQRWPLLEKALKVQAFVKGSKLSLTLFHGVHERVNAAGHLVNSFNLRSLEELLNHPEIQRGLYGGLQLFGHGQDSALFGEAMAAHGWPEMIPGLGKYIRAYKDNLFDDRIPRMKGEMYLQALARNRSSYPKLNEEQLATLTGRQSNATFGEQNYRQMVGKITSDPRFWQAMQGLFLAPDFGYSKLQHITQAFTPYGGEQRMAIGLVAAGLYGSARFMNYLLNDGNAHWEPEHAFSVIAGDRQFSIRSLPGDMQHLWSNQASYIYHRFSPFVNNALEAMVKRDFQGRPIGWADVVKDTVAQVLPIPIQKAVEGASALLGTKAIRYDMRDLLGSALGFSTAFYRNESEIKKWATQWKEASGDPKLKAEVERGQASVYPPSQYNDLRDALRNGDMETAQAAYDDLVQKLGGGYNAVRHIAQVMRQWKDGSFSGSKKNEPKFKKTLNEDQLKVYEQARAERKQAYDNFLQMKNSTFKRLLTPPRSTTLGSFLDE